MQREVAIKSRIRIHSGVWLPSVAAIILALDCRQNEVGFLKFLTGTVILLITHGVLLLASRFLSIQSAARRSEVGQWISYAVVLIGGVWVALRFTLGSSAVSSIAYLDGFVLGGLSGSLHFTHRCKLY